MRYSIEPRESRFVKGYGLCLLQEILGINIVNL